MTEVFSPMMGRDLMSWAGWISVPFLALTMVSCDSSTTGGSSAQIGAPSSVQSGVPTGTSTSDNSGALTGTAALDAEEIAFFGLINDYRAQNGLNPLQISVALTKASDWMSSDMATTGNFSHTDTQGRDPSARMELFGYDTSNWWGENIAGGNATAQATFTQWKNSSGHNANMLGANYKVIGIARAQNSSSPYGWYWTTDFGGIVDETIVP
jgi:uncharacterized protein YkwD